MQVGSSLRTTPICEQRGHCRVIFGLMSSPPTRHHAPESEDPNWIEEAEEKGDDRAKTPEKKSGQGGLAGTLLRGQGHGRKAASGFCVARSPFRPSRARSLHAWCTRACIHVR